jgi:hypothetical protein
MIFGQDDGYIFSEQIILPLNPFAKSSDLF